MDLWGHYTLALGVREWDLFPVQYETFDRAPRRSAVPDLPRQESIFSFFLEIITYK